MALTMNPMGFYAGDIGASMESEEERRRRLLAQQQAAVTAQQQAQQATVAPAAPVSPSSMQPVKETRTIDPRTGEVRVKIEGTERDLSAANPMTPTLVQPTAARANQIVQPPQAGQPAQMRQPQVVPTPIPQPRPQPPQPMPAAPVSPEMLGQGINLGQPPQPTVGQTLAGARQTLAEMPTAQGLMPQMQRQPQPQAMTPATAAGVAPTAAGGIDWNNILNGSIGSGRVRERVITDPAAPPDVRAAAIANQYNDLTSQRGQREAQQRAQDYIARNDTLGMARELQRDEGSWLKVLLYGALGGKDLARNELNKMGIGGKWVDAYDAQGNRAKIRVRDDGMPMEGFDSQGQPLDTQQLAAYSTGGKRDLDIVGGTVVNDQTQEVGRVITDRRTGQSYVQTDTGRKPLTGFRPQGQAGTLDQQRIQQIQQANIRLQQDWANTKMAIRSAGPEAANSYLGEFNARNGTNYRLQDLGGSAPQIDFNTGVMTQAPSIGAVPAEAAPAAPAAAPVAPSAAAPATAAPAVGAPPAAPGIGAPAPAPAAPAPAAPSGAGLGFRPTPGASPAEIESQRKIYEEAASAAAKIRAEDVANVQTGYGGILNGVETVAGLSQDLLNSPGFEYAVGVRVPDLAVIPGSDTADFIATFERLQGQAFLRAIEQLRGTGAISDREGKAATDAVAALSRNQSEKSFKRNLYELNADLRRFANRAAAKIGRELPYPNQLDPVTERRQDQEAVRWLRANPTDPRAPDIKRTLENKGIL